MKSLSTSLVSVALFVAAASAQITLNTPNPPTQCIPVQITWSGGTPPFFLAINPGNQPGAAALQQYTGLTASPFTWSTNITAGTSVSFALTDSTGGTGQTAPVTIQSGPDNSCLTATTPATSAGATSGAATSGAATSGTATSAGSTSAASRSTSGSATGSSSASASATGGSNGAIGSAASVGVVGVLSALAAALLA